MKLLASIAYLYRRYPPPPMRALTMIRCGIQSRNKQALVAQSEVTRTRFYVTLTFDTTNYIVKIAVPTAELRSGGLRTVT